MTLQEEPKHVAVKNYLSFNCNYLIKSCVILCNYVYSIDVATCFTRDAIPGTPKSSIFRIPFWEKIFFLKTCASPADRPVLHINMQAAPENEPSISYSSAMLTAVCNLSSLAVYPTWQALFSSSYLKLSGNSARDDAWHSLAGVIVRFGSVSSLSLEHVQILFKGTRIIVRLFITDICVLVKKILTIVT
jgi:hypothetical protein